MWRALTGLAVTLALVGCGGGGSSGDATVAAPAPTLPADLLTLFDYDASAPPAVSEAGVENRDGASVHDISFAGPDGRVTAYLVLPPGDGPFPAVVFMHGSTGYRVTFLGEALELAQRGIASILPDAPFARPGGAPEVQFALADQEQFAQTAVELRRAVDVLLAREDVDPARLAFVGHSWGADLGFLLAAVERRVGSFVLMSGVPELSTHLGAFDEVAALTPAARAAYLEGWRRLDGLLYVPHAAPSAVYIQGGTFDEAPTPKQTRILFSAASEPKKLGLYEAGHDLDAQARADRAAWLSVRFNLS